jgi:hypothetical protein
MAVWEFLKVKGLKIIKDSAEKPPSPLFTRIWTYGFGGRREEPNPCCMRKVYSAYTNTSTGFCRKKKDFLKIPRHHLKRLMSFVKTNTPSAFRLYGALVIIQILFGVNYVVSKAIIAAFHPLQWASLRLLLATPVLWIVASLSGRPAPKVDREFIKNILIFSFLGIALNQGAFLFGLKYTTSTNSAVLNTLTPIFTLLLVTLRGIEPFTWGRGVGFLFAFAGILTLRFRMRRYWGMV